MTTSRLGASSLPTQFADVATPTARQCTSPQRLSITRLSGLLLIGLVIAMATMAGSGVFLQRRAGLLLLLTLAVWGVARRSRTSTPQLLSRAYVAIYALPFTSLIGYLSDENYRFWETPRAQVYLSDPEIPEMMIALGTIGLAGLLAGSTAAEARAIGRGVTRPREAESRSLSTGVFLVLIVVAVGASWLAAPTKTIFTAAYASYGTAAVSTGLGLSAAGLGSYILIVYLWIDTERDAGTQRFKVKRMALLSAVLFIVLYLQLARGDRESSGLVLALLLLFLTGPGIDSARRRFRRRLRRVLLPAAVLLLAFVAIGSLRSELGVGREAVSLGSSVSDGFQQSTWSGVLLTNLSLAAQQQYNPTPLLGGSTYVDYVESLPPGFVASALSYERPISADRGPAWSLFDVSAGGVHAVVVPAQNFGYFGVGAILAFYGFIIASVDLRSRSSSFASRCTYGALASFAFLWFWYGDTSAIRGATILGLILLLDPVLSVRRRAADRRTVADQPGASGAWTARAPAPASSQELRAPAPGLSS